MDSNAFKTSHDGSDWRDLTVLGATATGILAIAVAFLLEPFGRPFVATSWLLVLGGSALTLHKGRSRWWGTGLVFAGLALPVAAFCYLWVAVSFGVLT